MLINWRGERTPERLAKLLDAMGAQSEHRAAWPLPNAKPVTEIDFWGWRSTYSFTAEVWMGQEKIGDEWATLIAFYADHAHLLRGGFAIAYFYGYKRERVEYFEWSKCPHKFEESRIGNCHHRYRCKACALYYDVDSSG